MIGTTRNLLSTGETMECLEVEVSEVDVGAAHACFAGTTFEVVHGGDLPMKVGENLDYPPGGAWLGDMQLFGMALSLLGSKPEFEKPILTSWYGVRIPWYLKPSEPETIHLQGVFERFDVVLGSKVQEHVEAYFLRGQAAPLFVGFEQDAVRVGLEYAGKFQRLATMAFAPQVDWSSHEAQLSRRNGIWPSGDGCGDSDISPQEAFDYALSQDQGLAPFQNAEVVGLDWRLLPNLPPGGLEVLQRESLELTISKGATNASFMVTKTSPPTGPAQYQLERGPATKMQTVGSYPPTVLPFCPALVRLRSIDATLSRLTLDIAPAGLLTGGTALPWLGWSLRANSTWGTNGFAFQFTGSGQAGQCSIGAASALLSHCTVR